MLRGACFTEAVGREGEREAEGWTPVPLSEDLI